MADSSPGTFVPSGSLSGPATGSSSTSTGSMPTALANKAKLPSAGRDRRPFMAALAIVLILVGAVLSALIAIMAGNKTEVLVANDDIAAGQEITEDDFTTVQVSTDAAAFIPVASRQNFIGSKALTYVPAGTMVTPQMFTPDSAVPAGGEIVGLILSPSQRPSEPLEAGDVVRLYSGSAFDLGGAGGELLVDAVRVVSVSNNGGTLAVSVLVTADQASALVGPAAATQVVASRLSEGTEPSIDFMTTPESTDIEGDTTSEGAEDAAEPSAEPTAESTEG